MKKQNPNIKNLLSRENHFQNNLSQGSYQWITQKNYSKIKLKSNRKVSLKNHVQKKLFQRSYQWDTQESYQKHWRKNINSIINRFRNKLSRRPKFVSKIVRRKDIREQNSKMKNSSSIENQFQKNDLKIVSLGYA